MFQRLVDRPLAVVIDTSVISHNINRICEEKRFDSRRSIAFTRNAIARIASLTWLNAYASPEVIDSAKVIWVKDTKVNGRYWRTDWLTRPETTLAIAANRPDKGKGVIARRRMLALASQDSLDKAESKELQSLLTDATTHYKAGRKQSSDLFMTVRSEVYAILDRNGWNVLEKPGYEADDFAATVCVVNQQLPYERQNHILLATVDTDWLGLVDHNVAWMCTTGYRPRLRHSLASVNAWAEARLGATLETPSDIWRVKSTAGDKSDNLPPGTPIELIDLKQPPEQHRLWLDPAIATKIRGWLTEPSAPAISEAQMRQVRKFFMSNTVQPPVPAFNPDNDTFGGY